MVIRLNGGHDAFSPPDLEDTLAATAVDATASVQHLLAGVESL
jgi:hypothetical protein